MSIQLIRFAETLKEERYQRGWSQRRIAEELGTDSVTISRWERGITLPSPYFREKLCLLFNKSASYLGLIEIYERIVEDEKQEPIIENTQQEIITEDPIKAMPLSTSDPSPTRQERVLACISYLLWWVSGLPLWWTQRRSAFVRLHARRSMRLFGGLSVLLSLLALGRWLLIGSILSQRQPLTRRGLVGVRFHNSDFLHVTLLRLIPLFSTILWLVLLLSVVLWVLAIWQAANGHVQFLPWKMQSEPLQKIQGRKIHD